MLVLDSQDLVYWGQLLDCDGQFRVLESEDLVRDGLSAV